MATASLGMRKAFWAFLKSHPALSGLVSLLADAITGKVATQEEIASRGSAAILRFSDVGDPLLAHVPPELVYHARFEETRTEQFLNPFVFSVGRSPQSGMPALTVRVSPVRLAPVQVNGCVSEVVSQACTVSGADLLEVKSLFATLQASRSSLTALVYAAMASGELLTGAKEFCEEGIIRRALIQVGGSRKDCAQTLGVNRTTLYNKLHRYKLLSSQQRGPSAQAGPPAQIDLRRQTGVSA